VSGLVFRSNLPEFTRQLRQIKQEFRSKVVRSANVASGGVLRAAVKAQIGQGDSPRSRTGTLRASVYLKRSRRSTSGAERHYVGVRGRAVQRKRKGQSVSVGGAFYWRFLEGGWYPRGPGRGLRGGNRSRAAQRERSAAAGARFVKRPFIQPAFERARGTAVDAFFNRMAREVTKLNAKR
jgi:hypothetical protein